jgi:penicillin-binding protein 1A
MLLSTLFLKNILETFSQWLNKLPKAWEGVRSTISHTWQNRQEIWQHFQREYPLRANAIKWSSYTLVGMFSLCVLLILFVRVGAFGKLPSYTELRNIETATASEIYSEDGVLFGKFFTENRSITELDSISPYVITALLAVEDKRFFEHKGVDIQSWLRVAFGVLSFKKNAGGGSTLSQQLAKNLYPRRNYRIPGISIFINKLRENFISLRLEKIYSKDELLVMYLNTVHFGGNRFGIQEAARYFYNKKTQKLSADEAATLIGMLKASTALDPVRNPDNALNRRNVVLTQMLRNKDFRFKNKEMSSISYKIEEGALDKELYDEFVTLPITAKAHETFAIDEGIGTYFREHLRTRVLRDLLSSIKKEDGSDYNIYTDGLKIYTTIDSRLQAHAELAVHEQMSFLQTLFDDHWRNHTAADPWGNEKNIESAIKNSDRYQGMLSEGLSVKEMDSILQTPVQMKIFLLDKKNNEKDTIMSPLDSIKYYFTRLNAGFLAMETGTGHIKAWVGGIEFRHFKYDHVLSKRQAGSTFKPIVFAAALNDSIRPCSFLKNEAFTVGNWSPRNSDGNYEGWLSVSGGMAKSNNIVAAKLIMEAGIEKVIRLAKNMGMETPLRKEAGISLGTADASLMELVRVYGCFANRGIKANPKVITKILDKNDRVLYEHDANQTIERILDENTALTMTRLMMEVTRSGTGARISNQYCPHCDLAGKTGTTQNNSDGWFIAYNPELVTGAWVGGQSPVVRFRSTSMGGGAATALPIVGRFWYHLSRDRSTSRISHRKYEIPEEMEEEFWCPHQIFIGPDSLMMIMENETLKDSLFENNFENLDEIASAFFIEKDSFGINETLKGFFNLISKPFRKKKKTVEEKEEDNR